MGGRVEQPLGLAELDDAAEIHDGDAVRDVAHHAQVVGDEQDGQAEPLLQLEQQVDDLRLHRDVERGDELVGDQALGLDRQRAGDADALALAAGELVGLAVGGVRRQAHQVQQLGDARLRSAGAARMLVDAERLGRASAPTVMRGLSEP